MREKKFHFQQYFLILIFLLIIVSFLTYLYSSKIIDESKIILKRM
ncbi:hypothetical protein BDCR2A_00059 [Borrelia duttonii CR2A]|uniref:Uncharacterized protein n=1 Tax=Borrelia duttonii CR2A TaxID=1432657 RepID=W6TYA7_9SPIR|nr:hypothetical protein BDCR2A_00059 [Borrelia duttonii CR2A]